MIIGILRKLAKLPIDNFYFATATGFVVGVIYWGYLAILRGAFVWVSLLGLARGITVVLCVVLLITMVNKRRLGEMYNNQLWYERVTSLVLISCLGVGVSAVLNNVIAFFLSLNSRG